MPGFVKNKKDEAKWSKAKEAAGKSTSKDSKSYWKLSNYIFHKMGKTEALPPKPPAPPKPTTSIKSPMKMGSTAVKTPKTKKLPGALDKPSLFFKSEKINGVTMLKAFLDAHGEKKLKKSNS
jgi:hypothetical protein